MSVAEELAGLLDPEVISTDDADRLEHSGDYLPRHLIEKRSGAARVSSLAIVRPRTTEEVSVVLEWADRTSTSIVPFGAGSGVCGGVADHEGVVVDLRAMDQVVEFDDKSRLVTAQAGMMGPSLAAFLDERGFMHGHEPQSIAISTVGGWLATRACGQLSARYGGIEDLVAGLEAVLPGGKVLSSKTIPRRATGPDVASLMIGSEGTLGIITQATLRISPVPRERVDRCLLFEHMSEGVKACRVLAQSELGPTVVRLYDRDDTTLFMRREAEPPEGCVLLLSFDGRDATRRADEAVGLCEGAPLDKRFVEHWWEHRNDAVEEFATIMAGEGVLGSHGVADTMEVAGTWTVLRDLYHSMKDSLQKEADFVGCHVSHVYQDGACLYFTMASATEDDATALQVNQSWWDVGMRVCLEAGGSISHHHGIGRLKAPWLPDELQGWHDVLVAVKKALDPKGIMNPGALGL